MRIAKSSLFALPEHIEAYLRDQLSRLAGENHLRNLQQDLFVERLTTTSPRSTPCIRSARAMAEHRRWQRRGSILDVASGPGKRKSFVHGGTLDGIELGQLPGLPLEYPEQLLLIPAPAQHRARTVGGLHVGGKVQIPEGSRIDEVNFGVPRVWVGELKRHGDPFQICAPGRTGPARVCVSRYPHRSSKAVTEACPVAASGRQSRVDNQPAA